MARYKNADWKLPETRVETWSQAQTAVLMDIRDELQKLNAVFSCRNTQAIPGLLRSIKSNTTKRKRPK